METNYKRTVAGSVGAGVGAIFNASGRKYYILEHKTESAFHHAGESQKIIIDQVELGRDGSCQVRFDESFATVSRRHAAIVKDGDNWKLIPLSQTNATFVNSVPVNSETILNNGDEIKLSSNGPVMGFIIPQGEQSMVKSIGLTERMNLFRKQALRPYKTALWIMGIVLFLAVGGLVTYNILQSKAYEAEMAAANEKIDAAQVELDSQKQKLVEAEEAAKIAEDKLVELQKNASATQEEIEAAKATARNAQYAAANARIAAQKASENFANAQAKLAAIQEGNETEASAAKVAEKDADAGAAEIEDEEVTVKEFSNITDCYNSVYFIRMEDISVYDRDNREAVRFSTENLIGGTGFLLSDGRFITADRVVEPWFYYSNTKLGRRNNHDWTFTDIQVCANAGLKVVANFTAYSPSGISFKFNNTEMTQKASHKDNINFYTTETVSIPLGYIHSLVKEKNITVYWHDVHPATDWATLAKIEQLNNIKGLLFDKSYSLAPKAGVEVSILGFPLEAGFVDSHVVIPQDLRNNINVANLNDENVIELSSRRWKVGNDGAPVLFCKDGQWTVIGVLSHTDTSDRDVVIPIANTSR